MRSFLPLLPFHFTFGLCLSLLKPCNIQEEGVCKPTVEAMDAEVCASGYWQTMPTGSYRCVDGTMSPLTSIDTAEYCPNGSNSDTMSSQSSAPGPSQERPTAEPSSSSHVGETGRSRCIGKPVSTGEDPYGTISYKVGGKMASVYVASDSAHFRCDIKPPADGMYVAVWTRYDNALTGQPQPKNCGKTIHLTNPKTGVSSDAMVIDRCASCVGVGHQISDNSTADNFANGATIDLSLKLWNKLYNNAPQAVYDIDYSGPIYGGSESGPPDELIGPYCLPEGTQQ